jgi:hypothetical protein
LDWTQGSRSLDVLEESTRALSPERHAAPPFESVVQRCTAEGLVNADGFAVDASLIVADSNKQRSAIGSRADAGREYAEQLTQARDSIKATNGELNI